MLGRLFQWILKLISRLRQSSGQDTSSDSSQSLPSSSDSPSSKTKPTESFKDGMVSVWFSYHEATHSNTAVSRGLNNSPSPTILYSIKSSARRLDEVRELLGTPILVNSWYRSPEVNKAVGGSTTSDHMTGLSIDFVSPKFGTPYQICLTILNSGIKYDQLIFETNSRGSQWVHIGFGDRMRQQTLTYRGGKYLEGLHV